MNVRRPMGIRGFFLESSLSRGVVGEQFYLMVNVMSWNARGLGRREKRSRFKKILLNNQVDFLMLQETKKAGVSEKFIKSFWGHRNFDYAEVEAEGMSGGLLCVWAAECFTMEGVASNRNFQFISGVLSNSFKCVFVNVYGPTSCTDRKKVWGSIVNLSHFFTLPWCMGGDFNEIRSLGERLGCSCRDRGMADFNNFIEELGLMDLPLLGRKFTWSKSDNDNKWSRLDRFLVNPVWLSVYKWKQWGLSRVLSDHCPIMLKVDPRDWGPKPFKFFNAWTLHPNFGVVVNDFWNRSDVQGWAGYRLACKLKGLKDVLKVWNREVFGNVQESLNEVENQINTLDLLAESGTLSEEDIVRKKKLKGEFWNLSRRLEWIWLQKSRLDWTMKGDKNTKFFHSIANGRQNRNLLNSLAIGDVHIEEPGRIRIEVFNYFKNAYKEEWGSRPRLGGVAFSVLDSVQGDFLCNPFSEEEVWQAVKACDGNKAPGPDGFNLSFIKSSWKVIKRDILQFCSEFHANSRLSKRLNTSFITLIPKVANPTGLSDYRPISLIGCIYKILAKVLAERLKKVLPLLISEVQSAFVGGRNIQDGVLIANEIVDFWKRKKQQGVLLKLDFQKAYDNLSWKFLLDMLSKFGFPAKWIKWMKECLSSAYVSVLVNGSPTGEFVLEKGLRQGDPLSPFLFVLAVEGLNLVFKRAQEHGTIKGVSVAANGPTLTHLQFADDTIVFCNASLEEFLNVKRLLSFFEAVSGLKINFHKSVVSGQGLSQGELAVFANCLGCKTQALPMKYLGLPLGANPRKKATWRDVIDRFQRYLATWKRRQVSFGGRILLIKSVLSNLPIYYLSLFKMPVCVLNELVKIQSRFLWGGADLKKRLHLVSWNKVTRSKERGGVGV